MKNSMEFWFGQSLLELRQQLLVWWGGEAESDALTESGDSSLGAEYTVQGLYRHGQELIMFQEFGENLKLNQSPTTLRGSV